MSNKPVTMFESIGFERQENIVAHLPEVKALIEAKKHIQFLKLNAGKNSKAYKGRERKLHMRIVANRLRNGITVE